jgi:hypothetical protein
MAILSNGYAAGKRRGDPADRRQVTTPEGGQVDLGDGRQRGLTLAARPKSATPT